MRILAVDTATETCGVAILMGGHMAAEQIISQGLTHTRTLMVSIQLALKQAGINLSAVDGFVVSQGPGSFTGLRIGLSTVKGLADASGKPLVGISTLAALAHQAHETVQWVCPMIDARRGEVYWSIYQRTHSGLVERCAAQAGSADQVFKILNEPCLFIGNGAQRYAQALAAASNHGISFAGDELNTLRAGTLARLGLQRFDEGMSDDPQRLGPIYVRPSDAQLSHEPGRLV